MKKITTAITLLYFISFLTGCGSLLEQPPTPEPVVLTFAFREGIANYFILAEEYQKLHPEITIKLLPIEYRGGSVDLNQVEADAIRWDANLVVSEQQGKLLTLDEMITADAVLPISDYMAGTLDALTVNGTTLGIPAGINPIVVFASVLPFQKAGTSLPSSAWTLNEMVYLAESVNRQDIAYSDPDYTIGLCTTIADMDPLILTYLYGGALFNRLPNPTAATLDTQMNIEAVRWINSLYNEYGITPNPSSSEFSSNRGYYSAIYNNKCGLWIGSMADFQVAFLANNWEYEARILPLPYNQLPFGVATEDGYFIYNTSEHPLQAWGWISFLTEHEEAAGMMVPPRNSQLDSDSFKQGASADLLNVARSMQENLLIMNVSITQSSSVQNVAMAFLEAVNQVITQDADPGEMLEQAQQKVEDTFQPAP